jgi:hypothetical protein
MELPFFVKQELLKKNPIGEERYSNYNGSKKRNKTHQFMQQVIWLTHMGLLGMFRHAIFEL